MILFLVSASCGSLLRLGHMSGKARIKTKCKWEICKQHEVSCKNFLYAVMTHFRSIVGVNAYLYMQLETGAVFSH